MSPKALPSKVKDPDTPTDPHVVAKATHIFVVDFGATPDNVRNLLMIPHSRVTSGVALGTLWGTGGLLNLHWPYARQTPYLLLYM